jgi:hypothetical protein
VVCPGVWVGRLLAELSSRNEDPDLCACQRLKMEGHGRGKVEVVGRSHLESQYSRGQIVIKKYTPSIFKLLSY